MRLAFDLEATGLLDCTTVDYTASPYKLKGCFKVHCAVFKDIDTGEYYKFVQDECYTKLKPWLLENTTMLIGNNIVSYDLMVMKVALGIDFTVVPDTICGKPVKIFDNLVVSKTLNPDRPSHSVEYFGGILGLPKIDWRAKAVELGLIEHNAPQGAEFLQYHPEMLEYNTRDADVSEKIYRFLMKEWGDWDWSGAVELEHAVREIITRQEHRGFWFNAEKAVEYVKDLDEKMARLKEIVEPLIPAKPLGKTAQKEFIPPKIQFKKNGEPSAVLEKWIEKHGGKLFKDDEGWKAEVYEKMHFLPMAQEPIITHGPATIKDTTHIKGWLVGMGWNASAYKERDLTVDSKKHKLSQEKYLEACERYIEQTLESPFKKDRLEHLEVKTEKAFRDKLYKHDPMKRPLKVYTNPTLTVGMEKEIDPNLLAMSDKFAHAKDVSEYLTYSHRRNSILGGGVDPDDEDEEAEKGWLSVQRVHEDHRIPTPADTCGAGTSRFKHRVVCNVSRVTSLYGEQMRSLFGSDVAAGFYQQGYDFSSLEAMIESHYCWRYDGEEKDYCHSLVQAKPNDVHTKTAAKISEVLGREFKRTPSKNVKYCCAYGGQPKRVAKTVGCSLEDGQKIYTAYWDAAKPLALLAEKLKAYWETTGGKKFILGLDGRKIPTRSASALINSLFQSAGVICAKRAMVIHDRMLKEEGLAVDFWKEDWKSKAFVQQMIAYHRHCGLGL